MQTADGHQQLAFFADFHRTAGAVHHHSVGSAEAEIERWKILGALFALALKNQSEHLLMIADFLSACYGAIRLALSGIHANSAYYASHESSCNCDCRSATLT